MAQKSINVEKAVQYVRTLRPEALDGLYFSCRDAMSRLGVRRKNGLAAGIKFDPKLQVTGNLRALIDFAEGLEKPPEEQGTRSKQQVAAQKEAYAERASSLQVLFDAVRQTMRDAKHDPQETRTQDDVDRDRRREAKQERQRNREARKAAHEAEKAKAAQNETDDTVREAQADKDRQSEADADAAAAALNEKMRKQERKKRRKARKEAEARAKKARNEISEKSKKGQKEAERQAKEDKKEAELQAKEDAEEAERQAAEGN